MKRCQSISHMAPVWFNKWGTVAKFQMAVLVISWPLVLCDRLHQLSLYSHSCFLAQSHPPPPKHFNHVLRLETPVHPGQEFPKLCPGPLVKILGLRLVKNENRHTQGGPRTEFENHWSRAPDPKWFQLALPPESQWGYCRHWLVTITWLII